jgi:hypothetical protein
MNLATKTSFSVSVLAFIVFLASVPVSADTIVGKVTSAEGRLIELDVGANKGIKVGDSGRIYYTVKIEGKDKPIYTAKFEVTHISQRSCIAQIQVKTGDVKVGLFAEIIRAGSLEVTSIPSEAMVHIVEGGVKVRQEAG